MNSIGYMEWVYGKGAREATGHLVLQNLGNYRVTDESLPKIMVAGVMLGHLGIGKQYELWEAGFQLETIGRMTQKYFLAHTIDQIITAPDWPNEKYWGEKLEIKDFRGVGKLVILQKGQVRTGKTRLNKYMMGGVISSKSLQEIGNQELWSGRMVIIPKRKFRDTEKAGFIRGNTLGGILTSGLWYDEKYWGKMIFETDNSCLLDTYLE